MKHLLKRTWAEINLDHIKENYKEVKKITEENTKVMAVVKADGYGHGDVVVAKTLEDIGVNWFGVSNIEEAILLRQGGISSDILIFGYTPTEMVNILDKWNFTQTIYSKKYADEINTAANNEGVYIKCHLKIDSGMGRIGLICNEETKKNGCIKDITYIYDNLRNLRFGGIFTHFSSADEPLSGKAYTEKQFMLFCSILLELENMGYKLGVKHACNSAATVFYKNMHLDMVRVGVLLYGVNPSKEVFENIKLKAAMTLKSKVILVKEVLEGSEISYGRKYKATKKTRIATIPIGYADGYSRRLSNIGKVEINNRLAPIIGNICMDQIMVDVSSLDVVEGDEVTLFGDKNVSLITATDLADDIGTINYEILTVLGKRVPRLYIKDRKEMAVTTYKGMEYSL